jgi:hypothetical protein
MCKRFVSIWMFAGAQQTIFVFSGTHLGCVPEHWEDFITGKTRNMSVCNWFWGCIAVWLNPFPVTLARTRCRPKRPSEQHGRDYFFVSREKFEEWIAGDMLLEHALVYGEYKGIPRQQVGGVRCSAGCSACGTFGWGCDRTSLWLNLAKG